MPLVRLYAGLRTAAGVKQTRVEGDRLAGILTALIEQHPALSGAVLDGERLNVFAVNRSMKEAAPLTIRVADRKIVSVASAEVLTGPDARAANSFERPDVVVPRPFRAGRAAGGVVKATLPPLSLAAMTVKLA